MNQNSLTSQISKDIKAVGYVYHSEEKIVHSDINKGQLNSKQDFQLLVMPVE